MVLFIIMAVIALASLGLGIYYAVTFIKNAIPPITFDKLWKRMLIILGIFAVSFTVMMNSIYIWGNIHPNGYELTAAIVGGLLVGILIPSTLFTFLFHYYGKGESKGITSFIDKWLFRSFMISFPLLIVSIFFLTEGFANYVTYPLVNGFSFTKGFVTPDQPSNIAFYALCIMSGAVFVYFLCDHKYYIQYGKHGILESLFLVAFPAGILGARIFYVVGNWSREFDYGRAMTYIGDFKIWAPLAIWEGGLTILGGAIMGIVVGVAWFMWRNKGYSIWLAVDIIVPTILIAQAVGRWGNFFNIEVHGVQSPVQYWNWLPQFIVNNAHYSIVAGEADPGMIYVPLFFIEFCTNLLGYFVIAHVFGIALRKHTELGDLAFGYIIWYGLTRLFLEPLRDTSFNMGKDGFWSWIWSLAFVIGGVLLIVGNHVVRYFLKPRKVNEKQYFIISVIISLVFVALLVPSIILLSKGHASATLQLNTFTWGLILLALSISALLTLGITLVPIINQRKKNASI